MPLADIQDNGVIVGCVGEGLGNGIRIHLVLVYSKYFEYNKLQLLYDRTFPETKFHIFSLVWGEFTTYLHGPLLV